MKIRNILSVVCMIMILSSIHTLVFAEDNLYSETYTCLSEAFASEDGTITVEDTTLYALNGEKEYVVSEQGIVGKTQLTFKTAFTDSTDGCSIVLSGLDYADEARIKDMLEFEFAEDINDSQKYSVLADGNSIGTFYYGQLVKWEVTVNTATANISVVAKTDTHEIFYTANVGNGLAISKVEFLSRNSDLFFDGLTVKRNNPVTGEMPIIYKEGNFYCAAVSTDTVCIEDGFLYLAAYASNGNQFVNVKRTVLDMPYSPISITNENGKYVISGVASKNSEVCLIMISESGEVVRYDQTTASSDGNYNFDGFVFDDGVYSLRILDVDTKTECNQTVKANGNRVSYNTLGQTFTDVYMYDDGTVGFDSLKAFVWDEEISPQTPAAEILKAGVPVTSVDSLMLDISSADNFLKKNEEITFAVCDADTSEYDGGFNVNILNSDSSSVYSVEGIDGTWNWTPKFVGKYYAQITGVKGGLIVPLGTTEFYVSNEKPSEDTFLFIANDNSYYRNDVMKSFESNETLYAPQFKDGSLYLSESSFYDVAEVVFTHNDDGSVTISQYGDVMGIFDEISCSEGECGSVIIANTNISVIGGVGDKLLYNFADIMSLNGYVSANYENVLAVSTNTVFDGNNLIDVSETLSFESFDDNSMEDWAHSKYAGSTDTAEISDTEYYRGGRSYKLGSCTKDGVYHELFTPLGIFNEDVEITSYTISFMAKASSDFKGSKLKVSVNGERYTICSEDWQGNSKISTQWQPYSVTVPATKLSGVEKIRFDIQMIRNEGIFFNNSTGSVWIDDIKIVSTKKAPNCYAQLKNHRISKETVVCQADFDTYCGSLSNLLYNDRINNGATIGTNISIASGEGYNNSNALKIGAAASGWKNVQLPPISIDKKVGTYTVRFKVKLSEDYTYNTPRISVFMYKGNTFKELLSKSVIADRIGNGEWTTLEVEIDAMDFMEKDYDNFRISLDTVFKTSSSGTYNGYVYFDDITVSTDSYVGETLILDMISENYASWYSMDEDAVVTYKPSENLDGISLIRGDIYNSDNEFVDSVTSSWYTAETNGWQWLPQEPGYYEVEFYAIMKDGAVRPMASTYSYQQGHFELKRKKVAVAQNSAPSVTERDSRLYFSLTYNPEKPQLQEDIFRAADLVGFKGPRWIHISWNKVQPTEGGGYDWTTTDKFFSLLNEFGYDDAQVCVMNTPIWASPSDDATITSAGMPYYGCYAPKDEYADEYKAFLTALIDRYGEKISLIEVGNEAYVSSTGTAFWRDTAANYVKMLTWAYDAIKEADSSIMVVTAGTNNVNDFNAYYEADPNFINKFDYFGIHGKYGTSTPVIDRMTELNIEPKWAATESYYTAYSSNYVPADRQAQALYFLMNIFSEVKYNAQKMTFYNIFNYDGKIEDEATVYAQKNGLASGERYNMFRHYPFVEPEQSAVTAFNLFNILGKDFSYIGEYTFDSTQRMVLFLKENGDKALAVWNSAGNEFALSQSILSEIGSSYLIKDMEGKTITDINSLKGNRVYYISNIASSAFDSFTFDDSVINSNYIAPYYTCETE